jgi:hypothetical protein
MKFPVNSVLAGNLRLSETENEPVGVFFPPRRSMPSVGPNGWIVPATGLVQPLRGPIASSGDAGHQSTHGVSTPRPT